MKKNFAYVLGIAYIIAGLNHFIHPAFYDKMIESFLPQPHLITLISGVVEIICGTGFLIPQTRKMAAWATVILLIAIFPANINMALHPEAFDFPQYALYLRLPLQFVLIWIAYLYTRD